MTLVAARAGTFFSGSLFRIPAARTQVPFADDLVLAVGTDAADAGRPGEERDRHHQPDDGCSKIVPKSVHLPET